MKSPNPEEILLSYRDLTDRWKCHKTTALRRLALAKIPLIHFTPTSARVRLSDILAYEAACTRLVGREPLDR